MLKSLTQQPGEKKIGKKSVPKAGLQRKLKKQ